MPFNLNISYGSQKVARALNLDLSGAILKRNYNFIAIYDLCSAKVRNFFKPVIKYYG